jgi:hypothetical protein
MNYTIPLLFILLSPGVLLTIPHSAKGTVSLQTVFVHTIIFAIIISVFRIEEGFQIPPTAKEILDNEAAKAAAKAATQLDIVKNAAINADLVKDYKAQLDTARNQMASFDAAYKTVIADRDACLAKPPCPACPAQSSCTVM